jgi:putative Holliday junction resolvase
MRILGIDYGRSRIGLALSDPTMVLASPLSVIQNRGLQNNVAAVADIVKQNAVGTVVIGVALHMDGAESELSRESRTFGDAIAATGIPVEYADERFTSAIAESAIRESFAGKTRGDRRAQRNRVTNSVDKVAACVILQSYLDKNKRSSK